MTIPKNEINITAHRFFIYVDKQNDYANVKLIKKITFGIIIQYKRPEFFGAFYCVFLSRFYGYLLHYALSEILPSKIFHYP